MIEYIVLGVVILILTNLILLTGQVATLKTEVVYIKKLMGINGKLPRKPRGGKEPR